MPASVSHTKFVQFMQNQNIVKTRFVFPTKARKTEILPGGFLWILNVLIIDDFLTAGYLVF